jgi:hypothetical protein
MEISATVNPTDNIAVIEDDTSMRPGAVNGQNGADPFFLAAGGGVFSIRFPG